MLRGFRWQLAALLLAAGLFVVSLLLRDTSQTEIPPQPTTSGVTTTPEQQVVNVASTSTAAPTINPNSDNESAIYREALVGSVQRLNPLLAGLNPIDQDITSLIFEGLTRTNAYGEPVPALAERWVISSDSLEYVVFLRQDVLWQDGVPFSAADVVYTISLLRDPAFPGPAELGEFWRTVETEQLGDNVIRFRLTQPLGTFLDKLRVGILPEHALRGTTAAQLASHPFNFSPVGTGPYQLASFGGAGAVNRIDLQLAPVYSQRPEAQAHPFGLTRISFYLFATFDDALNALQRGEIDGLAGRENTQRAALFQAANAQDLEMHNQIKNTLGVLIFNWEGQPYFRDQRVRVALDAGLNRASVIERTLSNVAIPANSPLMPGSWAYVSDLPWQAYDPDGARLLLAQSFERLASGDETTDETADAEATAEPGSPTYFDFTILIPNDPALAQFAQEIATQWSQLNLGVTVESVDLTTYQTRLDAGEFDVALVEYSLGDSADPDVYAFWHQGQYPNGENYGGADDRRVSELLERARRDPYGMNRLPEYREFQRVFAERAVALPAYYPLFTYVTARRVQGVQLGFIGLPSDRFRNIGEWSLSG